MQLLAKKERWLIDFITTTVVVLFLVAISGKLFKITGIERGCLDWPFCFNSLLPPVATSARLDWLHRILGILGGVLLTVSMILGYKIERKNRTILIPLGFSIVFYLAEVIFSASFQDQGFIFPPFVHGIFALFSFGSALVSLILVHYYRLSESQKIRYSLQTTFARSVLISLIVYLLVIFSGTILSQNQFAGSCSGWPLCIPSQPSGWFVFLHRLLVGITIFLITWIFIQAWRKQRNSLPILVSASIVFVLFFSQALLGRQLAGEFPAYLSVIHQATSLAGFAALVTLTMVVGLEGRSAEDEQADLLSIRDRKIQLFILDLFLLTKPIVVLLLLVTTFAGMVIGAQSWPAFSTVFWTLTAGFMAAGGSGAINQYLDREDDLKMQRTQKRPIPAGRLTPAEGLAFGSMLAIGSFFVLVAFINLVAAVLSLAGIIYYVLLYSIFLKKTTVQNIVIGGGAGAIPPLVGWAAATGSLNIPSLFLFAVIFMWTPPHFWALAIVRRNDYARAGVPMLPVVRGEGETRKQILIYTIELVILTLLLPVFGLGGAIYLIGAGLLGLWLVSAAYRVWKFEGNKVAWKMYRYSSMYLAMLFLVLMVDRII